MYFSSHYSSEISKRRVSHKVHFCHPSLGAPLRSSNVPNIELSFSLLLSLFFFIKFSLRQPSTFLSTLSLSGSHILVFYAACLSILIRKPCNCLIFPSCTLILVCIIHRRERGISPAHKCMPTVYTHKGMWALLFGIAPTNMLRLTQPCVALQQGQLHKENILRGLAYFKEVPHHYAVVHHIATHQQSRM